ncbi:transcription antitermination factor NusB [Desulforhopalus sp. IMCC35007]|uniref:transcription antitermination factor NusB n=1 Tax=Desulforhopalus sp. IMCC35007 TaxID=2569543 RepID=UPI0010AE67FD|nr:transcription antitermination factor NusB [Desulforhopalus sp. IMCC35007]TKB08751.1 transcription antitermination factor NusB [Desulforhopalus sp. IMCC35007]
MGIRRISRETALQFLYQEDFTITQGQEFGYDLEERFDLFCTLFQVNKKAKSYALSLLKGICPRLDEIDSQISKAASNWRLSRIAATDRNLLRIAVYEIIYGDNVPAEVAINEVVEIAKKFAGEESPKFINGILDAILTGQKS